MKKIIFLLIILFSISCIDKEEKADNYVEKNIGVVLDVNVVSTSFNESIKTQIKTNNKFFVVYNIPQLTFGDSLLAKLDGNLVVKIKDTSGKWYNVVGYKKTN
jgi:hypothetical protein